MLKRAPKHRERINKELAEGLSHLRSATVYAADGARKEMAPRVNNALIATGFRKKRRRRWPWVVGSVAMASAAAGTAGFMLWRRNGMGTGDYRDVGAPTGHHHENLAHHRNGSMGAAPAYDPGAMDRTERMATATAD